MSGLSPASFGYEKDNYQNVDNINMNKNASDMTIEAIKRQITPALNNLFQNIIKAQYNYSIKENVLPTEFNWNFGANEKIEDLDKIRILRNVQGVSSVPQELKMKVVLPILKKIIDEPYAEENKKEIEEILNQLKNEREDLNINFGEI